MWAPGSGLHNLINKANRRCSVHLKGHRWRARAGGENRKGPLSHHPHLWRLVCLECIKPGLSGFPVKTGCLPLGCLIALCSLQDSNASCTNSSSDAFAASKNHVSRWKPNSCGAFSEIIMSSSWLVLFQFHTQECTYINSHLVNWKLYLWHCKHAEALSRLKESRFWFTQQFGLMIKNQDKTFTLQNAPLHPPHTQASLSWLV